MIDCNTCYCSGNPGWWCYNNILYNIGMSTSYSVDSNNCVKSTSCAYNEAGKYVNF